MDYGVYEIFWVNVGSQHQYKGVGERLVNAVIDAIKRQKGSREILLTAHFTEGLPRYYAKFGFTTIRVFGDAYHLMALTIR
jgi:predicted N-acetyltransferase YhbS